MTMLECLMLDFQKIMSWKLWINYDSRHVQRRMDRQSEETGAHEKHGTWYFLTAKPLA